MYPAIFYVLKCLIFKQLLKIANISAKIDINRYIKSLEYEIMVVPLLLKCVRNTIPENSSLTILIAKKRTAIVTAF